MFGIYGDDDDVGEAALTAEARLPGRLVRSKRGPMLDWMRHSELYEIGRGLQ